MCNLTIFHNVFYAIHILESFNSHISVVVCSFFEFGTVSKWCVREWVNGSAKSFDSCQAAQTAQTDMSQSKFNRNRNRRILFLCDGFRKTDLDTSPPSHPRPPYTHTLFRAWLTIIIIIKIIIGLTMIIIMIIIMSCRYIF